MPALWLLIAIVCNRHDCTTEVQGSFANRALCLAEAARLADRDWHAPGFGCQPAATTKDN